MTILQDRLCSGAPRLACGRVIFCVLTMMTLTVAAARAQAPSPPGPAVFYAPIEPLAATIGRTQADPRPASTEGAIPILGWLLYSGLGWGATCDNNVNSTPINRVSACGPSIQPSLVAQWNTGIQRTLVYGVGDIRYYPSLEQVDVLDTTLGVAHVWEIQRDLIFRIQGQVTQGEQGSAFSNFIPLGVFATSPVRYTQEFGSTSIQKNFGSFFTAVGGSITGTEYQNVRDNLGNVIDEQFQNGTVSTFNTRFGYYISPIIYTYVEPSYNWTRYQASNLDSEGYRVVAGIGSDLISLFRGEFYGGYLSQRFDDPLHGVASFPVFGGRLSWYPTRFITLSISADQTFGTSDFQVVAFTPGSATEMTTVKFNGGWDFSQRFAFSAIVTEQHLNYLDSFRKDDLLTASAGVTYKFNPRLGITLTYTHQHLYTNQEGAAFSRDFVSVGGRTTF